MDSSQAPASLLSQRAFNEIPVVICSGFSSFIESLLKTEPTPPRALQYFGTWWQGYENSFLYSMPYVRG